MPVCEAESLSHGLKKLRIRQQDKALDTEVLMRTGIPSIHTLMKSQMRWWDHVTRMSDEWLPKIFYSKLKEGNRFQGGKKKHFRDSLKLSLGHFNIDPELWEDLAHDCSTWQSLIHTEASLWVEETCWGRAEAQAVWISQQQHVTINQVTHSDISCSVSHRQFKAQIGLISHSHVHRNQTNQWCHGHSQTRRTNSLSTFQ